MTPPPYIFLSFLNTLYGQVSGKSSEVAIKLSILVSWIATTCGESQGKQAISVCFMEGLYSLDLVVERDAVNLKSYCRSTGTIVYLFSMPGQ